MSQLSLGGLPQYSWWMPKGWIPSHRARSGHNEKTNAAWMGYYPAPEDSIARLKAAGFTPDPATLVGRFHPEWSTVGTRKPSLTDDIDKFRVNWSKGGVGSRTYQMQHVPDGIDRVSCPRWWIHHDGKAYRSKGMECVHQVDMGDGHMDNHLGGWPGTPGEFIVRVEWDEENKWWIPVAPERIESDARAG